MPILMVPYDACLSKAGAILPKKKEKVKYTQHVLADYTYLVYSFPLLTSFHPTISEYAFFSSTQGTFTKREHVWIIKQTSTNLKELKSYRVSSLTVMELN